MPSTKSWYKKKTKQKKKKELKLEKRSLTNELGSLRIMMKENKMEHKKYIEEIHTKKKHIRIKIDALENKKELLIKNMERVDKARKAPVGDVIIVFTDVQGSTRIWEADQNACSKSMDIHNNLIRKLIETFDGYEVKTEGDAFMIAFSHVDQAIQFSITLQSKLIEQKWPKELYQMDDCKIEYNTKGQILFRGLRVRLGMNFGPVREQEDVVTGRVDYFGPVVNKASRVEGKAVGGLNVISESTWNEMKRLRDNEGFDTSSFLIKDMGKHSLKGIKEEERLHAILPPHLFERVDRDVQLTKIEKEFKRAKSENSVFKKQLRELKNVIKDKSAKIHKLEKIQKEDNHRLYARLQEKVQLLKNENEQLRNEAAMDRQEMMEEIRALRKDKISLQMFMNELKANNHSFFNNELNTPPRKASAPHYKKSNMASDKDRVHHQKKKTYSKFTQPYPLRSKHTPAFNEEKPTDYHRLVNYSRQRLSEQRGSPNRRMPQIPTKQSPSQTFMTSIPTTQNPNTLSPLSQSPNQFDPFCYHSSATSDEIEDIEDQSPSKVEEKGLIDLISFGPSPKMRRRKSIKHFKQLHTKIKQTHNQSVSIDPL
mmetsp:Transcript_5466/g.8069  ORF Transcript_5466/g.8069 Transcript_5466/m.8069 type:complete len:596 (+) Transcript_5466:845-2632(+)